VCPSIFLGLPATRDAKLIVSVRPLSQFYPTFWVSMKIYSCWLFTRPSNASPDRFEALRGLVDEFIKRAVVFPPFLFGKYNMIIKTAKTMFAIGRKTLSTRRQMIKFIS
jgi:hypothetical protein